MKTTLIYEINEDFKKIKEQMKLNKSSRENYLSLLEYKYVLEKLFLLFSAGEIIVDENEDFQKLKEEESKQDYNNGINYIAGLCNKEDELKICKLIFRKGKDRAVPNFFEIKIKEHNSKKINEYFQNKVVFLIFIQGDYFYSRRILNSKDKRSAHFIQLLNIPNFS